MRPGWASAHTRETIPADGIIVHGEGGVDESSLTGESFPHQKKTRDTVKAGTIVQTGYMEIEITAKLQDSVVYKVFEMVEKISMSKTPTQALVDQIASYYIPIMIFTAIFIAVCLPIVEIYIPSFSHHLTE